MGDYSSVTVTLYGDVPEPVVQAFVDQLQPEYGGDYFPPKVEGGVEQPGYRVFELGERNVGFIFDDELQQIVREIFDEHQVDFPVVGTQSAKYEHPAYTWDHEPGRPDWEGDSDGSGDPAVHAQQIMWLVKEHDDPAVVLSEIMRLIGVVR